MSKFLPWLIKLTKETTGVITSLTALVVAIYALLTAFGNSSHVSSVESQVNNDHNSIGALVETHNANIPTIAGASSYYVQLATYKLDSCDAAASEITGYKSVFDPPAKLWSEASGKYLVIAVQATTLDDARAVVKKANEFAKDPSQSGNDLAHALIRVNPNWQPHTC